MGFIWFHDDGFHLHAIMLNTEKDTLCRFHMHDLISFEIRWKKTCIRRVIATNTFATSFNIFINHISQIMHHHWDECNRNNWKWWNQHFTIDVCIDDIGKFAIGEKETICGAMMITNFIWIELNACFARTELMLSTKSTRFNSFSTFLVIIWIFPMSNYKRIALVANLQPNSSTGKWHDSEQIEIDFPSSYESKSVYKQC